MAGIHRVQHLLAGETNCPKTAWGRKGVRDRALKTDGRRGDGWGEQCSHPNFTKNLQAWTMYCYFSHLWNRDREYLLKISEVYFTQWNIFCPLLCYQDSVGPCPDSVRCFQSAFAAQIKFPSLTLFLLHPIWQWHTNHQGLTPQSAIFGVYAVCGAVVDI